MALLNASALTAQFSIGWRALLLGTAAAGALCVSTHPAAAGPDTCPIAANVATCSGNQSDGIDAGADFNVPPVDTLVVNNLTQDIIGSNGTGFDGIRWATVVGGDPINIISNTGNFSIRSEGSGINAASAAGGSISVNHTGNIFASSINLYSAGNGPTAAGTISFSMIGNLVANSGINARSFHQSGNGNAGSVIVSFTGDISTENNDAIEAESNVSAGNGNSGNVTVESKGNFNGGIDALSNVLGNGNSGIVDVTHQGLSGGVSAQSLVGGNGNAGAVIVSRSGNTSGSLFARSEVTGSGDAGAVSVTSNGDVIQSGMARIISAISRAATDGDSGSVTATSTGHLSGGAGIEASSEANGTGSTGGVVVSSNGNINSIAGVVATTRAFGSGTAGLVTVNSTGNIAATGETAITAISDANNGNSGVVSVTSTGNLTSVNHGIYASSITTTGNAGTVSITSNGSITAAQDGINAASIGPGGLGANISVTINGGTVQAANGAGVRFGGGATNTLVVGSNAALLGTGDFAIFGAGGNETVNNSGIVAGHVSLGGGTNTFNNLAGSLFNARSIVDLGANGTLNNAGTFAPGGSSSAPITTTLTGNFAQGAGGTFAVDVGNGTADRVNVSGTANLSGSVRPTVSGLTSTTQQFTILSAAGGATNNGITVQDTTIFNYELLFPNANDMVLAVTASFSPNGISLTPNQRVTAAHLQSALLTGGGNLGDLIGYLGSFTNGASYAAALDRLHPEPYLAPVQSTLLAGLGFTESLMSCPTLAQSDVNAFIADGQCAWARTGARQLDYDRTTENIGFRDTAWGGSAGVQFALAPGWFGSVALGYDNSRIQIDDRASASGDLLHIGAGIKYLHGNWLISAALAGGHASYDVTRSAVMPGVNTDGHLSLNFLSGRLRAAYVFGGEGNYVKPMIDIDLTGIRRSGVQESGAGAVGLAVQAQTNVFLSVAPAIELGGRYVLVGNTVLQPFLRGGVRIFREDNLKATASFIGSPADAPAYTVTMPLDQWMAEMAAGVELLSSDRFDARLSYEGRFGENLTQHGGSVKLRAKL